MDGNIRETNSGYLVPDPAPYTDLRPVLENYKQYDDLRFSLHTTEKRQSWSIKTVVTVIVVFFIACVLSAGTTYIVIYSKKDSLNRSLCQMKNCGLGSCSLSSETKAVCICPEGRTGNNCEVREFHVSEIRTSCPTNWNTHDTWCYNEIRDRKTWFQSREFCRSIGADLLSIHSQSETEFLSRTFPLNKEQYWIGLNNYKNDGNVKWIDGTTSTYTNWKLGEPNNLNDNEHCVHVDPDYNGTWNDNNCYMSLKSICKLNRTSLCGLDTWLFYNGSCYLFVSQGVELVGWNRARAICHFTNADLVNIHSKDEYNFLLSQVTKYESDAFWIGLNDREKSANCRWSDGSVPTFLSWNIEEPDGLNDHCVAISSKYGNWEDENCDRPLRYICEKRVL